MRMSNPLFLAATLLLSSTLSASDPAVFLQTHCIRCHGEKEQEADRRFDTLSVSINSLSDLETYQIDRFRFIPEVPYTDLYRRHYRGGHIGFEPLALKGVPFSGRYTVRVKAAAVDRTVIPMATRSTTFATVIHSSWNLQPSAARAVSRAKAVCRKCGRWLWKN